MTKIPASARLTRIRSLLKEDRQVSIPDLAGRFAVSEMTIRRDLDKLARNGQVRRTHGGAMPAERMVFEFDFASRRQAHRLQKQAIAREALKLIQPAQRLILDTGTTTLELAYALKDFQDITVITPSLAVASVLQFSPQIETVLLGGIIRQGSPDLAGLVTEKNLEMFSADIAFQGADGIGLDGTLYTVDMRIVEVDRKIRQQAQRTFVLADSSKIGKTALMTNGLLREVEALITDDKILDKQKKALEKKGAKTIVTKIRK
jgi:DeoR/GlpR family transcriptional regulator of sugar metabolism